MLLLPSANRVRGGDATGGARRLRIEREEGRRSGGGRRHERRGGRGGAGRRGRVPFYAAAAARSLGRGCGRDPAGVEEAGAGAQGDPDRPLRGRDLRHAPGLRHGPRRRRRAPHLARYYSPRFLAPVVA